MNDVLDMSRIESGNVKLEEVKVHLPDVFHDLRVIIQGSIAAKQQELYIDTQNVVHEDVVIDKLRLNQVLLNIVGNAVKFTSVGGMINIRVSENPCSKEGYASYSFSVKDNGIGMSEEFQEHIFDAFAREQTVTKSGIQGTGLGMAISKNIVNMMGGTITVNSEVGKGSEFIVSIECKITGETVKYKSVPELQGARALVVDDDANTCMSVCKMLRDIEMLADWTTSGKEAVLRAKEACEIKKEFKAYIIDWQMPDMNGIETVRRIRKVIGNDTPIIILTAYDWADIAEEAKEAGVTLCMAQIQYPGSAFQYVCNIADAGFLSTMSGKQWQKDYLSGKANVSNTPGMMESMEYIQKWKDLGMLDCSNSDPADDGKTREAFIKGNSLFLLGPQNGIMDAEDTTDKFGLMPYLSEDGSKNVFILNVNRFYGLNKKLENDPEKLEDALKVMKVLSTVEGTSALYPDSTLKAGLLPFKDAKADDTYYADISDFINAGNTTPFIYSGWENTIVNTGTKMLEFMQDKASIKDVADQLDEDQDSVVNNQPEVFTTATEEISQESCAKLVGRCFAEATGSDVALISLGTWISGNGTNQNNGGVSGKLYAKNITDYDICTILPTGWSQTIQTVRLTGKQIQALYEEGYDAVGTGKNYPYMLVNPENLKLEEGKTYQVAISGISEKLASETEVTDSGIVGLDAAKDFLGQFKTLSEADAEWK